MRKLNSPIGLLLTTLLVTYVEVNCLAQTAQTNAFIFQDQGITITSELSDCHDEKNGTHKQYHIIRIENNSASDRTIAFSKELWYNGKCLTCNVESEEYTVKVNVPAQSVAEGSCTENGPLRIFSKMLDMKDVRQLTHFELKNLNVSDAQP